MAASVLSEADFREASATIVRKPGLDDVPKNSLSPVALNQKGPKLRLYHSEQLECESLEGPDNYTGWMSPSDSVISSNLSNSMDSSENVSHSAQKPTNKPPKHKNKISQFFKMISSDSKKEAVSVPLQAPICKSPGSPPKQAEPSAKFDIQRMESIVASTSPNATSGLKQSVFHVEAQSNTSEGEEAPAHSLAPEAVTFVRPSRCSSLPQNASEQSQATVSIPIIARASAGLNGSSRPNSGYRSSWSGSAYATPVADMGDSILVNKAKLLSALQPIASVPLPAPSLQQKSRPPSPAARLGSAMARITRSLSVGDRRNKAVEA